ncbi:IS3 family transposase [Streptomyces sp. NPDC020096]
MSDGDIHGSSQASRGRVARTGKRAGHRREPYFRAVHAPRTTSGDASRKARRAARSSAASSGTSHERSTDSSSPLAQRPTTQTPLEPPVDIHRGINAAAESFFTLLREEIGTRQWPDRASAHTEIFAFIETFYNRKRLRRHPVWGYLTPLETRQRHEQGHALAA